MDVILEVIEGKDKGKRFEIKRDEPDNITAGRSKRSFAFFNDETSQLQISKEDLYLSRWHFLLQIRPPNCYIRHIGHTNPTYINDFSKEKVINKIVEVKDGDIIKAGKTHLKVHIHHEKKGEEVKYYCVSCQKELPNFVRGIFDDLKTYNVLCPECQQKKEEEKRHAQQKALKKISCVRCGEDVTEKADADGRARELQDVAMYLCKDCVPTETEEKLGKIHEYQVLSVLGKGGMGVVYKAWHKRTGRLAALKQILPEIDMMEKALVLFQREIQVMRGLIHPNVIRFYESGTYKGKPYFACEYLMGGSVDEMLVKMKKPFSVKDACKIILDTLEGLSYAHDRGIVHRDISPANMLFTLHNNPNLFKHAGSNDFGTIKLSDMGLSKSYETAGQSGITQAKEVAGKLLYMAPEQIYEYRFVKPPADVYSTGVSLYYMLTGKFPYEFPSVMDIILGFLDRKEMKEPIKVILEDNPIPIRKTNSNIPERLAQIVDKALSKRAMDRYPSAREMKHAIEKVIEKGLE